jgi:hypothetical protein
MHLHADTFPLRLLSMKVFLSHASQDKAIVNQILEALDPAITAWIDQREILWGDNLEDVIQDAINSSAFFILVVSKASLKSDWVQKEIREAIAQEKRVKGHFVLPILLPEIKPNNPVYRRLFGVVPEDHLFLRLSSTDKSDIDSLATKIKNHIPRLLLNKLSLLEDELNHRRHRPLYHIIAWEGMEAPLVSGNHSSDLPDREFLLVRGSLESLPWLSFHHSDREENEEFITLVCDIEYLSGYHNNGRIRPLRDKESAKKLIVKIDSKVKTLVNSLGGSNNGEILKIGIPIRFGFQEVLVNVDRVEQDFLDMLCTKGNSLSYSDLSLSSLLSSLKEDCTLGLWSVPHATLSVMALLGTQYSSDETQSKTDYEHFWDSVFKEHQMIEHLKESVKTLLTDENKPKWEIVDSPTLIADELVGGSVGIMIGAGTWATPVGHIWTPKDVEGNPQHQVEDKTQIMPILPREGLLAWIDCAAILDERGDSSNKLNPFALFNYWLKKEVQLDLSSSKSTLRACPVTKEALRDVLQNVDHPSYETLRRFSACPNYAKLRPPPNLNLRELWSKLQKKSRLS